MPRDNQPKQKVLLLFNRVPYPLNNGGAIAMFNSVKEYAALHFEVHVLSMNTAKHFVEEHQVQAVFGSFAKIHLVYVDNRITYKGAFLNLFSEHSYMLDRYRSKEYRQKLCELLKNHRYDIIQMDSLSSLLYLETARQYSSAKIFYRPQNVESQIWSRILEITANPIKRLYLQIQANRLQIFEWEAIKKVDVVLPLSFSDEAIFRKNASAKVFFLPVCMSINQELPQCLHAGDIFFIGAMDWAPNAEGLSWFLKNIWPAITQEFASLSFFVAGSKMPDWMRQLKSKNVIPVGEVENAQEFMQEHGVMVAPILTGSGIRIKVIEAMALGKVVIATRMAAEGSGATDGVNILIAHSAKDFVDKLKLCQQPEVRAQIGRNARQFAIDNFSESRLGDVLNQIGIL